MGDKDLGSEANNWGSDPAIAAMMAGESQKAPSDYRLVMWRTEYVAEMSRERLIEVLNELSWL